MEQVESITDYLKRRLREEVGAARFEALAEETSVTTSFIRKFVYGSRENPRVGTIQPLLDYFKAVDAGEKRIDDLRRDGAAAEQAGEGAHPALTGGASGPAAPEAPESQEA